MSNEMIAFCFVKIEKARTRYHADVNVHLDDDDTEMRKALICALTDTADKLLRAFDKTECKEVK